jgi:hypothetical protein
MENNELKHYGILGMRWGVRRSEAQLRRARGSNKTRKVTKEQYEEAKKKAIDSGDIKQVRAWETKLSRTELESAIKRVELHQKLYPTDKGKVQRGYGHVKSAMNVVGDVTKMAGTALGAYAMAAKVNNTFNKKRMISIDGTYYKDQNK